MDLKDLQEALAGISQVGRGEKTFDFNGIPTTLRVILPNEEVAVQKYAGAAMGAKMGEEDDGGGTTLDYLHRFKVGILSYALIAVGPSDFRELEFVETGEKLENGTPIKIPKHEAMRKLLETTFGRAGVIAMFKKYGELAGEVELEAEKSVTFKPVDLNAEIERLENRVAVLKEEKEEAKKAENSSPLGSPVSEMVQRQTGVENAAQALTETTPPPRPTPLPETPQTAAQAPPEPTPPPVAPPAPGEPRQPVIPQSAPPPPRRPEERPVEPVTSEEKKDLFSEVESSFVDPDDGDFQKQIQAENERMARQRAAREQAAQEAQAEIQKQEREETKPPVRGQRTPPHVAAKETAQAVGHTKVEAVGRVGGTPAFQVGEKQTLTKKPRPQPDPKKVEVNTVKAGDGTQNPNFVKSPGSR